SNVADGQRSSEQVEALVRARIVTLKLRADETLTLVARGDDAGAYERDFKNLGPQVSGTTDTNLLVHAKNLAPSQQAADEVQAAIGNTNAYLAAHQKILDSNTQGRYEDAVAAAIKQDAPDSDASAFAKLDDNLLKS